MAWGFEVATWAVGFVPIVGYFGSQIMIAYDFGETLVQSWVQSFAYLVDGNFSQIGPTLGQGVVNAVTGLVNNEIQWILGQLPPLPPLPPFSAVAAASTAATPQSAAALTATAAEQQPVVVTPATGRFAAGRQLAKQVASDVKAVASIPRTIAKAIVATRGAAHGVVSEAAADVTAASDVTAPAKSGDAKAVDDAVNNPGGSQKAPPMSPRPGRPVTPDGPQR